MKTMILKRNLFICVALATLFLAACKNEDIVISREVSFEVIPYAAVSDFARYEVNPGDLTNFKFSSHPEMFKLRTYILVYDAEGILVNSKIEDLKNFNEKMTASFELSDGVYNVVSLAHIYFESDDIAYWYVDNIDCLDSLKVINNDKYYDTWIKQLGLQSMSIEVGHGSENYVMNLQSAVALMVNYFHNIHYYPTIFAYLPYANKMPSMIAFDAEGEYQASYEESEELDYPLTSPFVVAEESNNVYWYYCFTPLQTTSFGWFGVANDGQVHSLGTRSANIQAGKVFRSVVNLQSGSFEIEELKNNKELPCLSNNCKILITKNKESKNKKN